MQIRCSKKRTVVWVSTVISVVGFIYVVCVIDLPLPERLHRGKIEIQNLPRPDSLDYDRFKDVEDYDDLDKLPDVEVVLKTTKSTDASVDKTNDWSAIVVFIRQNLKWKRSNVCQQKPLTFQSSIESSAGQLMVHMVDHTHQPGKGDLTKEMHFELLKTVHSNLAFHTNSVLIDVGAGDGSFSILAAKIGRHAISVESNENNIHGLCASVEFSGSQPYITIIQNNSSTQTDQVYDISNYHLLVIDAEISCVSENNGFSLNQLINLETLESQTPLVIRIEAFQHNIENLLMCAGDFFANFDIQAIIMPWSDHNIREKKKLAEHLTFYKLKPYEAIGVEKELFMKNVEYWPTYVLWKKTIY